MISPVTDKKKVNWVFYTVFTGVTIYYLVRQHSFVLKHETQFSDACHAPLACSLTLCVFAQILSWTGVWAFSRMLPEACTPAGPCRPQQLYTFNFSYLKPSWFGSTIEVLPLLALLTNFPLLGNARSRQGARSLLPAHAPTPWHTRTLQLSPCVTTSLSSSSSLPKPFNSAMTRNMVGGAKRAFMVVLWQGG